MKKALKFGADVEVFSGIKLHKIKSLGSIRAAIEKKK
jgi:hypothetical protein